MHIMLPKTSVYVKGYDGQTEWMYVLVKDNDLFKKCNTIWDKVRADIKKEFDSEPVYNRKKLKTKIISYGHKDTDFGTKEILKVGSNHTFFSSNQLGFCSEVR